MTMRGCDQVPGWQLLHNVDVDVICDSTGCAHFVARPAVTAKDSGQQVSRGETALFGYTRSCTMT
jgi:hypothetical protein